MEAKSREVQIQINGKPYLVDAMKQISYEQVIEVTQKPHGTSVVYMSTKGPKENLKAGFLLPKETIEIEDGLDLSAHVVTEDLFH